MREDFPTPEEPRSAVVPPARTISHNSTIPSPLTTLATTVRAPIADSSASARSSETCSRRSDLFKTMMGRAPLSHASVRYLSTRRALNSRLSELTSSTVSTFAATICSSVFLPAVLRENLLCRSKTKWIVERSPCSSARTQSPTAGNISREAASWRSFPRTSAQRSPFCEIILYSSRFSSLTLARTKPSDFFDFHCPSKNSHQPNSCNRSEEHTSELQSLTNLV